MIPAPDVVDVTAWVQVEQEESLGARKKAWLLDPSSEDGLDALFKLPRASGLEEEGADLWAEWVASRIGVLMGVPIAPVEFAVRGAARGVLIARVGADLRHGNQLLFHQDPAYAFTATGQVAGYSLAAIRECLEPYGSSVPGMSAFGNFAGYLTLDALIANTDRHHENWAVDGTAQLLVPSYDHGVSLGYNVPQSKRVNPEAVARRAHSRHFPGRISLVDLAHEALHLAGPAVEEFWISRVENFDLCGLSAILASIPDEWMSEGSRTFVQELVTINQRRLLT